MPTAAGITISQIECLLECVTRATKSEKQAAFARLGLKVLRGTHTKMARSLIKVAATQGAAVAAAMEVWWEYANDKARDALRSASLDGKGPPRARRPPSTNAFFKANGEVTPVGEFAFEWVRANGARGQRGPAVPSAPASENVQGGPEHQALQRALRQMVKSRVVCNWNAR